MDKLTGSVRVFARAKPEDGLDAIQSQRLIACNMRANTQDKLEIVKSIQRQGQATDIPSFDWGQKGTDGMSFTRTGGSHDR